MTNLLYVQTWRYVLTPYMFAFEAEFPFFYYLIYVSRSVQELAFSGTLIGFYRTHFVRNFDRLIMKRKIGCSHSIYEIVHRIFRAFGGIMNCIFYKFQHISDFLFGKFTVWTIAEQPAVTAPARRHFQLDIHLQSTYRKRLAQYPFLPRLLRSLQATVMSSCQSIIHTIPFIRFQTTGQRP